MDDVRRKLANLAGHSAVADEVDGRIARHAAERVDAIAARLDELRPTVLTSPGAADEYLRLVAERGRLQQIIPGLKK